MKKVFISIAIFATTSLFAQVANDYPTSLTLEQYRDKVLEYSQELKQAKESIYSAEYEQKAAFTGYLPQIAISANASYDFMPGTFLGNNLKPFNYAVDAGLTQSIYAGGALRAQNRISDINVEISKLSEQLTIEEILYHADVIYWQTALCNQMMQNAETYYKIVEELFNIINIRFDDGLVSKSDLLMVNTRLKEAELLLNEATRTASISNQYLNILMGIPVDHKVEITDKIDTAVEMPDLHNLNDILQQRKEYQILDAHIAMQQMNVKAIKAKYNPTIVAGVNFGWGTPTFNTTGKAGFGSAAIASFNYPILQWGRKKYEAKAADIEINKLNFEKVILTDQINNELSTAWINLNDNSKRIEIAKENLSVATENMEINVLRYNDGLATILDVLSAQLSWIQANNNTAEAEFGFKVSVADYKRAIGNMK